MPEGTYHYILDVGTEQLGKEFTVTHEQTTETAPTPTVTFTITPSTISSLLKAVMLIDPRCYNHQH